MPRPQSNRLVSLSGLQLDVMRVLWQRGTAATAEVLSDLEPRRKLAHTTIATVLTRLEKRGLVTSARDGRQLIYSPEVTEKEVRRSMVSELVSTLFAGDPTALVTHLVRESEIHAGDLEHARMLLDKEENNE